VTSLSFVLHELPDDGAYAPMLTAAQLYYEDDLSQQQIAERLGVSRSTVSRLLQLAREQGIVHIEIRPPTSASRLSAQLEAALGLRRATVVPAPPKGAGLQILVAPALEELGRLTLGRDDVLAISSGATLWEVVRARRFPSLNGVRVVPALGGWDEADVRFQTNEMARRVADASGAEVSFLHAPALPSPELRKSLLADPDVAARLALWDRLSAALVGIGGPPNERELAPSHILAQREELAGAVGDVAARHFDLEGNPIEPAQEVLCVSREQLRGAGTVIGVSAGPGKAAAIVGAARARLVDVVVTDAPTAATALELVSGE
jgi:DNA-binding transcriptional regulator LsrR (DeoR family)